MPEKAYCSGMTVPGVYSKDDGFPRSLLGFAGSTGTKLIKVKDVWKPSEVRKHLQLSME